MALENPTRLQLDWKAVLDSAQSAMSEKLARLRDLEHEVRKKHMTLRSIAGPSYHDASLIILGVCAMERKARCKPMREILARLPADEFTVIIFDQELILEDPVVTWPICDVLIAFYSDGFPLQKVEKYCELRNPMLINDVTSQRILWDRVEVYKTCQQHGIPIPSYHVVYRNRPGFPDDVVVEGDDWIEINGARLYKPFVEKPVDADNHEVCIYYPRSTGGGCKELFRKVRDRSSSYHPDVERVRRDDSYLYETFYPTDGSDVKVYAVTELYAHAEARKSPAMDGIVKRDHSGAEVRYPVFLKNSEKDIARKISLAFKQRVCGFDLLRTATNKSLVCDVNGWSFVKRNVQYTKDCAALLANVMRVMMGRPARFVEEVLAQPESPLARPPSAIASGQPHEELRAVIAIFRHGDRTPKQKLKFLVDDQAFLALFARHGGTFAKKEIKLKSATELADVLDVLEAATTSERMNEWPVDMGMVLEQARAVLEIGGKFRGINRKVQVRVSKETDGGEPRELQFVFKWGGVLTALGRQTAEQIGRSFRERLYPGTDGLLRLHATYRHDLKIFSSDEGRVQVSAAAFVKGLLDLEGALTPILESLVTKDNALLHDNSKAAKYSQAAKDKLKALFERGNAGPWLERESPRDRIPASVARSLEETGDLKAAMKTLHDAISDLVTQLFALVRSTARPITRYSASATAPNIDVQDVEKKKAPEAAASVAASLGLLGYKAGEDAVVDRGDGAVTMSDMLRLCYARWEKLERDFFKEKSDTYDISKIPDIFDCAVYDVIHNHELLRLPPYTLVKVYRLARPLANIIVPQEYGETALDKLRVGALTCSKLCAQIKRELHVAAAEGMEAKQDRFSVNSSEFPLDDDDASLVNDDREEANTHRLDKRAATAMGVKSLHRHVRSRIFFTSESHLYAMLNVLRFAHLVDPTLPVPSADALEAADEVDGLGYLTHIVFRLIEVTEPSGDTVHRLRVSFSNGVNESVTGGAVEPAITTGATVVSPMQGPSSSASSSASTSRVNRAKQLPPASKLIPLWAPDANLDLADATRLLEFAYGNPNRNWDEPWGGHTAEVDAERLFERAMSDF